MPELPDICLYVTRLQERLVGQKLLKPRIKSSFLLRTVDPPLSSFIDHAVVKVDRLGKRLAITFQNDQTILIHLMIAGRLTWKEASAELDGPGSKIQLATFQFEGGTLGLNEAGTKKRASIHLLPHSQALAQQRRPGIDLTEVEQEQALQTLAKASGTIKRTLTDPDIIDGIGNAYSDEILFRAQISPLKQVKSLSRDELLRVVLVAKTLLNDATETLIKKYPEFPKPSEITAFRPEFAVHGKFGKPCPICGTPIQKIQLSENEINYCAKCQTGGKVLADRSLSRVLKDAWPHTIDDLER